MAVSDLSIPDLELRIRLGNMLLKWLRSYDPMLTSDEYKHLVHPTIDRLTAEVREMTVAFLGDSNLIVSISSLGDSVCRSLDMSQRVDTPSVRAFLNDYVTLP